MFNVVIWIKKQYNICPIYNNTCVPFNVYYYAFFYARCLWMCIANRKYMFMRIRGRLDFAMVKHTLDAPTRFHIGQATSLYMVYGHNMQRVDILRRVQPSRLIRLSRNKSAKTK